MPREVTRRFPLLFRLECLLSLKEKGPLTISQLIQKTNLNYNHARDSLSILRSKGLVIEIDGTYSITEEGKEIMTLINSALPFLGYRRVVPTTIPVWEMEGQ